MPGRDDGLGKDAEKKIQGWLSRPIDGYSFDRIPDQLTGFYGSKNICDFTCYKHPYMYYIESKATWNDRFEFSMLSDTQRKGLLAKSTIDGCHGWVIVLFATYKRAFVIDIREIARMIQSGVKSVNILKIDKWKINYKEIRRIPNNRKKLLDYEGHIEEYIPDVFKEVQYEEDD